MSQVILEGAHLRRKLFFIHTSTAVEKCLLWTQAVDQFRGQYSVGKICRPSSDRIGTNETSTLTLMRRTSHIKFRAPVEHWNPVCGVGCSWNAGADPLNENLVDRCCPRWTAVTSHRPRINQWRKKSPYLKALNEIFLLVHFLQESTKPGFP